MLKGASLQTVLITGASGFVGENLAHRFHAEGYRVILAYGTRKPMAKADRAFEVDLSVQGHFTRALGDLDVDAVVHAAAVVSPDLCEKDPERAHAVNVEATREIAQWAEKNGARMIFFSTDLVYDGEKSPYREEDPPNPINVYGKTKLEAEEQVQLICSDWIILRLALSYGPTRGARGDWTWKMRTALKLGKPLRLYTDQFRTPAYAGDTEEAVLRTVRGLGKGIYHVGGRERISRYGFGLKFVRIFGLPEDCLFPVRMEEVDTSALRGRDCSLVTDRMVRDLDLTPCDVEGGLYRQKKEEEKISWVQC